MPLWIPVAIFMLGLCWYFATRRTSPKQSPMGMRLSYAAVRMKNELHGLPVPKGYEHWTVYSDLPFFDRAQGSRVYFVGGSFVDLQTREVDCKQSGCSITALNSLDPSKNIFSETRKPS
jgi:hypothetical protein